MRPAPRFLENRPRHPAGHRQASAPRRPHGQTRDCSRSSRAEGEGAVEDGAQILPAARLNRGGWQQRRHRPALESSLIPTTHRSRALGPRSETRRQAVLQRATRGCRTETRAHLFEHRADRMAREGEGLGLRAAAPKRLDCCGKPHLCYLCCIWFSAFPLFTIRRQSCPRAGPRVPPRWPFQHR